MRLKSELYQEDIKYAAGLDLNWDILNGKTIMVTGASGMIGTFLIDVLMYRNADYNNNITVFAMSRNKSKLKQRFGYYSDSEHFRMVEHDVTKEITLTDRFDYIIHAASNTHPVEYANDPIGTITTNVFGTYNLLEYAAKGNGCKVVLLSSVEIYGENYSDVDRFSEKDCGYIDCNTLRAGYPESKRLSEAMLQAYRTQKNINALSVRLCRTYGPTVEKDDSKALTQFIRKAVNGEDIVLKSDGKQLYSYIYVADAVSAVLYAMLKGTDGEAYNVADTGSDITLKELAESLAEQAGSRVLFELPDNNEKKGYSTATKALLEAEKLRQLGWQARYTIGEGLERTIAILRDAINYENVGGNKPI